MTRTRRGSRPLDQELPQPKDPLSSLPNTCVYDILEHFTAVELIGVRRVSRGWKDAVDWKLAGIMRKCRPEPVEGADEEQAILEFRRDIYRQQARNDGKPTFVRRFTHATQGFAMCGDYFCWIDDTCLNVQLVFNSNKTGFSSQVERCRLTRLLGVNSLFIETVKPQEVGSITDQPLLMIKYAGKQKDGLSARDKSISPRQVMVVICVKSRKVLWSTAHDNPFHSSTEGKLVTLNHTALAYITFGQPRPTLYVRGVLTGEIKANKPIPDDLLPFPSIERIKIQLHPRRDLVYVAVPGKVFFFSATTANCVGRLCVARVSSPMIPFYELGPEDGPPRLRFSEYQPKCSPSAPEKFFLYYLKYDRMPCVLSYCCFEYEIPTDEDISISETRILQYGDQGSEEDLIFKAPILRIQIYENRTWLTEGPPELDPMLKQLAHTSVCLVDRTKYTRIKFRSYTSHCSLPERSYDIILEPNKPHDGSIPVEFYPQNNCFVLVTKPKGEPGHARRHNERAACILPKHFASPITLTERFMLLTHQNYVYLFSYDPGW